MTAARLALLLSLAACTGDPCFDEGAYQCGAQPRMCCGGSWTEFYDGPCGARDAGGGPPDCVATPVQAGCPCATDGVTTCMGYAPSIVCTTGTWTTTPGHACCR